MSQQGPLSPSTIVSDATFGTVAWANPSNAASSDDVWAIAVTGAGQSSEYLKATVFGFTIPPGATILGILLEIERQGASSTDARVRLVKGNVVQTTDKASGTAWLPFDQIASYGGSTDLWGNTWTDADINGTGFGAVISGQDHTCSVDHLRITVFYDPPTDFAVKFRHA
jgi:hypothetical protein